MNLYTKQQEFSRKTGKPVGFTHTLSGAQICDYSGLLIAEDADYENRPLYSLNADYNRDCEEVYYYDDEAEAMKKLGVEDYGKIFEANFVFQPYIDEDGKYTDYSRNLVQEWVKALKDKTGYLAECATIEEAMRKARVRTAMKLLVDKTYTAEELGLVDTD